MFCHRPVSCRSPTGAALWLSSKGTFTLRLRAPQWYPVGVRTRRIRDRFLRFPGTRARFLTWAVALLAGSLAAGALVGVGVASIIHIPDVAAIKEFSPGVVTQILDSNRKVFKTYARERRTLLAEDELTDLVRNTILAGEDGNFYKHGGFDLWAILRSSIIDIRQGRYKTGASTITMQLARSYFDLSRDKLWRRKISEALLAVELEKTLSKDQILTLYANDIFLGEGRRDGAGLYGLKEATRYYFDKDVMDLTPAETATLMAINRRPSDTPYNRPKVIRQRRDLILNRMLNAGSLSAEEHSTAIATPVEAVKRTTSSESGRYFSEDVRRHLINTYGAESLYERGLRVHTTMDLSMQWAAEKAVRDGLGQLDRRWGWRGATYRIEDELLDEVELSSWSSGPPVPGTWYEGLILDSDESTANVRIGAFSYTLDASGMEWTRANGPASILQPGDVAWFELEPGDEGAADRLALRQEPEVEAALVLIESRTGAVRAMVGGWDYGRSEFNRATQAHRQVGSAFKPFIFGAALEMGYTPADTLFDGPVVFRGANNLENYSPRNFKRRYYGITTLRRALELSINVTSAKLLDMVGVDRVIDFAQRCGLESYLPPYPSLALGTAELTPLEVAAAYATLANQGVRIEPYLIDRVTTRAGRVLEEHILRPSEVIEPQIAFLLTRIMQGVIRRGTASSIRNIGTAAAGKTGTTDFFTDAWFVGYTPRYTLLVWVGYDQSRYLGRGMTGAAAALPIWRLMIEEGLEAGWLDPDATFEPPPGLSTRRVEYRTGLLPGPAATQVIEETFLTGTEPEQTYDRALDKILALPWYQQRPRYGVPKAGERMPEDVADWTLVQESWELKDDPKKDQETAGAGDGP